jgi:hypothetical protein
MFPPLMDWEEELDPWKEEKTSKLFNELLVVVVVVVLRIPW